MIFTVSEPAIPKYFLEEDNGKQARAKSETTMPPGLGKEMGTQITMPIANFSKMIGPYLLSSPTGLPCLLGIIDGCFNRRS